MSAPHPIDFAAINAAVLDNPSYLERRLPNAKRQGRELKAGDIHGAPGDSFSINTESGQWADFATDERGGDPVSLVAAQEGVSQGDAANIIITDLALSSPATLARKSKEIPYAPTNGTPTIVYPYFQPDGQEAYLVGRWEQEGCRKSIRPGKFDEHGNFVKGMPEGSEPIPYNLVGIAGRPAVLESGFVVVVEGENKANALINMGICATCNQGGAGKWKDEYAQYFQGKGVVILPDNDKPGKDHAETVAASLAPVAASVKIVELPGLPDKGDIVDWLKLDGNDKDRLQALMNDAPEWKPPTATLRPLQVDPSAYNASRFLAEYPPSFLWVLQNSLMEGALGIIFGPPGCGKGMFVLQMLACLAAGIQAFCWNVPRPFRVLYISAEDTEVVLHRRVHHILKEIVPERLQRAAAERFTTVPVCGDVALCAANARLTGNRDDLTELIKVSGAEIVVLDTLARFFGGDENDNPAATRFCAALEALSTELGCTILLIHHASKSAGNNAANDALLTAALEPTSARGASGLIGACRWALGMAPLGKKASEQLLGVTDATPGQYVAFRTAKKNAGAPEQRHYLQRGEHGLLYPVTERGDEIDDAAKLAEEVRRRQDAGESALSLTRGGHSAFGWGMTRSRKAAEKAIQLKMLSTVAKGNGQNLCTVMHQEGGTYEYSMISGD